MANISSYPLGTPASGDLIPGTQKVTDVNGETKNLTKNFTVSQIAAFANTTAAYTVYSGYISQSSTSAPTADVLQNTTGAVITWARTSAGIYTATADSGIFTSGKVLVFANTGGLAPGISVEWERTSTTVMTIKTNGADGKFVKGAVEIRIYT